MIINTKEVSLEKTMILISNDSSRMPLLRIASGELWKPKSDTRNLIVRKTQERRSLDRKKPRTK